MPPRTQNIQSYPTSKKKKSLLDQFSDFRSGFVSDLAAIPSSMARDISMGLNLTDRDADYYDRTSATRRRIADEAAAKTMSTSRDDDKQRTVADVLAPPDDPMSDALQKLLTILLKKRLRPLRIPFNKLLLKDLEVALVAGAPYSALSLAVAWVFITGLQHDR